MSEYAFTKLFSTITDSSIWCEDSDTRVCWITMLAMADREGRVLAAVPGLAKRAAISLEATEKALEKFLSPDRFSRDSTNEGRRLETIPGGWRLLNYAKYRSLRDQVAERERKREWARDNRRGASEVAHCSARWTQAEVRGQKQKADGVADATPGAAAAAGVDQNPAITAATPLPELVTAIRAARIEFAALRTASIENALKSCPAVAARAGAVSDFIRDTADAFECPRAPIEMLAAYIGQAVKRSGSEAMASRKTRENETARRVAEALS